MSLFNKTKTKWKVLFFVVFGAFCIGILLSTSSSSDKNNASDDDSLSVGVNSVRISENCVCQYEYYYTACGHSIYDSKDVDKSWVGLTESELNEVLGEGEIESFSSSLVKIKYTFRCYCENHYILKEEDGELCVYNTQSGSDEQVLLMAFKPIDRELTVEEKEALKEGKVFNSIEDIISYIDANEDNLQIEGEENDTGD
ncbi:MAG: hypothetical protein R2876_00175 [Eubacteriales bacterium]